MAYLGAGVGISAHCYSGSPADRQRRDRQAGKLAATHSARRLARLLELGQLVVHGLEADPQLGGGGRAARASRWRARSGMSARRSRKGGRGTSKVLRRK